MSRSLLKAISIFPFNYKVLITNYCAIILANFPVQYPYRMFHLLPVILHLLTTILKNHRKSPSYRTVVFFTYFRWTFSTHLMHKLKLFWTKQIFSLQTVFLQAIILLFSKILTSERLLHLIWVSSLPEANSESKIGYYKFWSCTHWQR